MNYLIFFSPFKVHGSFKVFFNGEFYESQYLPINYLPKWILISTPFIFYFYFFRYTFYSKRLFYRFLNIKKISPNNDLWKSSNEKFDLINFISFFQIIAVYFTLNMNLIKGWTHFIFMNYFLIYFTILGMHILFLKIRKNKKIVLCSIILFILFTFELIYKLYIYHPYQSLYLNNFVSKNSKSLYEADYQSLSRFNGILDILNDSKK